MELLARRCGVGTTSPKLWKTSKLPLRTGELGGEQTPLDAIGDDEDADLHDDPSIDLDALADDEVESPQIGEDPFKEAARLALGGPGRRAS